MTDSVVQPLPSQSPDPAPRRGASNDRQQAVAIQRKLETTILDPKTPAASVASCAVAWTRVQDAKRVIDGKPLPGMLQPGKPSKRKPSLLPLPEVPAAVLLNSDSVPNPLDTAKQCESASVSAKVQ